MLNKMGDRIPPWRTPLDTKNEAEIQLFHK